ncbi:MAG: hypothetical protein ACXAEX_21670 [Promethearchaeota archaeon]
MAQSSAIRVFPLAVGLARTRFLPSSTPVFIASSCGGYSSFIPWARSKRFIFVGMSRSAIFTGFRSLIGVCGL